jgi:hypothetical protein
MFALLSERANSATVDAGSCSSWVELLPEKTLKDVLSKGLREASVTLSRRGSASLRYVISNNSPRLCPNQWPGSTSPTPRDFSAPPPSPPFPFTACETYLPLHFFVRLHGSSSQNPRRLRRAAPGAIRTWGRTHSWTPYLRICVHGQHSTTFTYWISDAASASMWAFASPMLAMGLSWFVVLLPYATDYD